MNTGYKNNRRKKADNLSDILPSYKNSKQADIGEIFIDRSNEDKVSFKKGIDEIIILQNEPFQPNPETEVLANIASKGFKIVDCISEDLVLPTGVNLEFEGPLQVCGGGEITVPQGTTLTIV